MAVTMSTNAPLYPGP